MACATVCRTSSAALPVRATPFCDRRFKGVQVFGQYIGRSFYELGLRVAAAVCWIFNRERARTYWSMANIQLARGVLTPYMYWKFGEKLIDFSYNDYVFTPSSNTEENALRARYGSNTINQWLQIGTKELPLNRDKLKRIKKGGACGGMSFDFVQQYFQQIQKGASELEAVRTISTRYTAGASDKAQLVQIFMSALPFDYKPTKCFQALSSQFGFQIRSPIWIDTYSDCDDSLCQILKKIPNGCYMPMPQSDKSAHSTVLIKSSNQYFLFDPSIGTLRFKENEIAKNLWDIRKFTIPSEEKFLGIFLYPCTLR